jgi:hypothetical protein
VPSLIRLSGNTVAIVCLPLEVVCCYVCHGLSNLPIFFIFFFGSSSFLCFPFVFVFGCFLVFMLGCVVFFVYLSERICWDDAFIAS